MNSKNIPYDRLNPLSFWINNCQVKDLPIDQRNEYVKEFWEKQNIISEQVVEFKFKSRKRVSKITDMTDLEKQQWILFLKYKEAEILEHNDDDIDFFNQELEEFQGYNEELYIDTWEWNVIKLTNIYGWPGDNQSGGIFVGLDLVFENSDTRVDFPRISDRYDTKENEEYLILNQRKDAISHIKGELFCFEPCGFHEHCNVLMEKSDTF